MSSISQSDIAIVGMACRLPDANTPDQFWRNVASGRESVRFFSEKDLRESGVDAGTLAKPEYVRAGVVLDDMEMFDAGFFGLSPKEAAIMDPQHRQFLECAWEALESAGHVPETFAGSIGVFAGCGMNAYLMYNLITNRKLMDSTGMFLVRHTGNDKDFLSTRVSYQFNLRGPSLSVQTACSTSLVAIHLAAQSLLSGECDMALAGGVTIEIPHRQGYMFQEGEILSEDGHCRPFDRDSNGTIFGSGAGIVVLRRLSEALEDGDTIYAVLKGSAINNDGSSKIGYLAPSVEGQARATTEALALAGIDANTVTYVETHGTGTVVGDPIEITALTDAFRQTSDRNGYCAIGSVKSNIGHLDTAAGVASFIKTIQALRHRQLPPSLHFRNPNSHIDFPNTPFFVNTQLKDWASDGPRRAGVNSLGVGGTNAHAILEEGPQTPSEPSRRAWQLIPLSARSPEALDRLATRYAAHFGETNPGAFADSAFTAQTGRKRFRHRKVIVARDGQEAATALSGRDTKRVATGSGPDAAPQVIFVFPGGGAQHPNMGRELYEREPVFRGHVDECLAFIRPHVDFDLKALMYPSEQDIESAAQTLRRPLHSILSIFIVEYALARLWMSWGIAPKAMTGHSLGEYTAACLAGVLSLQDALTLVIARGRVFERMPQGAMLSVALAERDLKEHLTADLTIAAVNGPESCVASGQVAAIEDLERRLNAREIECARVHISVAAHSPMLDPFLDEFGQVTARIALRAPSIPCLSNLTGTWMKAEDLDTRYWVRHLRGTVRFSDGLTELFKDPNAVFLEVGPGTTLSSLITAHPDRPATASAIASMRHPKDTGSDQQFHLLALGRLWIAGVQIDWSKLWQGEKRQRVSIPTYAFEHQKYWIEPGKVEFTAAAADAVTAPEPEAAIRKLESMDSWFWRKSWVPADAPAPSADTAGNWLIFMDRHGLGEAVADLLRMRGACVTCVSESSEFAAASESEYSLAAGDSQQYTSLLAALIENGRTPRRILYLWPYGPGANGIANVDRHVDHALWGPVALIQTLAGEDLVTALDLTLVSSGAQSCGPNDPADCPERALLAGPAKVIPQEYPGIASRWIDVQFTNARDEMRRIAEALVRETEAEPSDDRLVAYRQGQRMIESWERASLPQGQEASFRESGVYVITGGLGGMALTFARHLVQQYKARVVLLHRSSFPAQDAWQQVLDQRSQSRTAARIRQLLEMQSLGGTIELRQVDAGDASTMRHTFAAIRTELGTIHGVIHTAGVMNDGLIQEKSREQVLELLAPKVHGTLALDALLAEFQPEFLMLCSSTSALLGLPGQVDYTAANAFLDAYAQANSEGRAKTRVLSLNWGVWSEVGMAADSLRSGRDTSDGVQYSTATHWVLDEHRIKHGPAILPGTAYVDLALAAAWREAKKPVVVRDLILLAPMVFEGNESRQVSMREVPERQSTTLTVTSASPSVSVDHAQCEVLRDAQTNPDKLDVSAIRRRCSHRIADVRAGDRITRQDQLLDFGPRWQSIRQVHFGDRELFAELRLADEFAPDLVAHPAHPALLDMAVGCGLALVNGVLESTDLWVPVSFGRIAAYRPLGQEIYSHVRLRPTRDGQHATAVFDVTICDPAGNVLLEINDFTMRCVPPRDLRNETPRPQVAAKRSAEPTMLEALIAAGISAAEGIVALERALAQRESAQLVASSIDLNDLRILTKPKVSAKRKGASNTAAAAGSADEVEVTLSQLWSDLLGVDAVGLDDDFFDLGGHSLIAVRLFAKLKKAYRTELGLATLFEARTVRALAALLRQQLNAGGGTKTARCVVPLRKEGAKPILFCVHGVGGNVLGYNELVKNLPADQPFYAIQSINLIGDGPPLTDMRAIAEIYVKEMREVQPEGPYYLCGYSFGGVAAYEMAQQLTAAGQRVALLAIFDSDRPNVRLSLPTRLRLNLDHLLRLSPSQRKGHIVRKVRTVKTRLAQRKGTPRALPAAPASSSRPDVRALNFQAYRGYFAQPYSGSAVLFQTREVGDSGYRKPQLGWSGMFQGGLEIRSVPGNHITVLYPPNVVALAAELRDCLDAAYRREGAGGRDPQPAAAPDPAEMAVSR